MQRAEKMARDAYYFLVPLIVLAAVSLFFGFTAIGFTFTLLGLFVAFFFRDPERTIPNDPDSIVSPADGKILRIEPDGEGSVVSIFLSVFDVHINRAPIAGVVVRREHHPGRFLVAYDDRASVENERLEFCIRGERELTIYLIAGIVARRIVVWKGQGGRVEKGDRIGLIRFGSRVDVFLPPECEPCVNEGDRVCGGSSVLAYWKDTS